MGEAMRTVLAIGAALAVLTLSGPRAHDRSPTDDRWPSLPVVQSAAADRGVTSTYNLPPGDKGAGIVGLKAGVLLPQAFSPLGANFYAELEFGYLLPFLHRLFAITGSVGVTLPTVSGVDIADPRVSGMTYSYQQTTQQFLLGLTITAKIPFGRIVPYLGVGPRAFVVRTPSGGQSGAGSILPTNVELSIEPGVGVPIGLDVLLGPGRVFGEAQLLYAPASQRSTGPGSFGSMTVDVGYRFIF